jgi:putative hydrolase of the HAD superfamily
MTRKYILFDLDQTLVDRPAATRKLAGKLYDSDAVSPESIDRKAAIDEFIRFDKNGYQPDKVALFTSLEKSWGGLRRSPEELAHWLSVAPRTWYEPDPSVNSFLQRLNDSNVVWGIVTNGSATQTDKAERLELLSGCSCLVISKVVGVEKPDPAIFEIALNEIGSPAPHDVLFVGDNPIADIAGARAHGMSTAWIQHDQVWPADLEPPDYVFSSVLECEELFG